MQGISAEQYNKNFETALEKKRSVERIQVEHMLGKSPENRLPLYKRKFTPITQYDKNLKDNRTTQL